MNPAHTQPAAATLDPPPAGAALALMPNLFVIGASKAGSSALHAYIGRHPAIAMSTEKEPCFFVDREELRAAWPIRAREACSHDWDAYLQLWSGGEAARYRGESSVYYSQAPHRSGVAARIAAAVPEARIIYTVREPVGRAVAHYWQRFKEFQEELPIERAMRENPLYRDSSDYDLQLHHYLAVFPASQIKVVVAEELSARRREVLAELYDWLGLPPHQHSEAELADVHKSPPTTRQPRFPLVRELRNSALWASLRRHLPKSAVDRLRSASTTTMAKAEVDESGARAFLKDYLAPRTEAFEAWLGRSIPQWHR